VPLEACRAAGQVIWPLSVAVRFKPLPGEEQREKRLKDEEEEEDWETDANNNPNNAVSNPGSPPPPAGGNSNPNSGKGDVTFLEGDDPRSWAEAHQDKCEITDVIESSGIVKAVVDDRSRTFQYNDVFSGATTQQKLYDRLVAPLTRDVMFGYSATIFVYGQVRRMINNIFGTFVYSLSHEFSVILHTRQFASSPSPSILVCYSILTDCQW